MTLKRLLSRMDDFDTVIYLLIGAIVVLVIVGVIYLGMSLLSAPQKPHAFSDDVLTVVGDCAEANTYSSSVIVSGVAINSHSVNADEMVRCLYAAGITLYQHGDPVQMKADGS